MKQTETDEKIEQVLSDFSSSYWLKSALSGLLKRDIVDAMNDVSYLKALMEAKYRETVYDVEQPLR